MSTQAPGYPAQTKIRLNRQLVEYLHENFPRDVFMPVAGKAPMFRHKDGAWSWDKLEARGMVASYAGDAAILLNDLCCVDVDSKEFAASLEAQFPELLETAAEETRKGMHYLFAYPDWARAEGFFDAGAPDRSFPVDFKAICSTGTSGILVCAPSKNKRWVRAPWECQPKPISRELVTFLYRSFGKTPKAPSSGDVAPQPQEDTRDQDARRAGPTFPRHRANLGTGTDLNDERLAFVIANLSPGRADSYDSWMRGMCAVVNACHDAGIADPLPHCVAFSELSPGSFDHDGVVQFVRRHVPRDAGNRATLGTLLAWLKADNATAFAAWQASGMKPLIEKAVQSGGKHGPIAEIVKAIGRDKYAFCGKTWFYFEGHRWHKSENNDPIKKIVLKDVSRVFMSAARDYANRAIRAEDEHEEKALMESSKSMMALASKCLDINFARGVAEACQIDFADKDFRKRLDANAGLLGFDNGVYDLEADVFRPGRPDDYITMSVGFDYVEEVNPEVRRKVDAIFTEPYDDPAVAAHVRLLAGYALHGDRREEAAWFFTGSGSNGKSLIMNLLENALGGYCVSVSNTFFSSKRNSAHHSTDKIALKGARLAVLQEAGATDDCKIIPSEFKDLVSADRQSARELNCSQEQFVPQVLFLFCVNTLPGFKDMEGGTARRIRVLSHSFKFVANPSRPHEKLIDPNLKAWIKANFVVVAQQTMLLMLEGWREYNQLRVAGRQMTLPAVVQSATQEYVESNELVRQWFEERVVETGNDADFITVGEIKTDWKEWNRLKGAPPPSNDWTNWLYPKLKDLIGYDHVKLSYADGKRPGDRKSYHKNSAFKRLKWACHEEGFVRDDIEP